MATGSTRHIALGFFRVSAREREYVNDVLDSNRLSYGKYSATFERQFADAHGCAHAVFCNSGTSALHIALSAMKERYGWRDGDEVIVPAVTFIATSNIVLYCGLKPVFVDVDAQSYNIAHERIEDAITARTRAVIPVHLCGLPCDMGPILDVAGRRDLRILEDSCETMFATYKGQSVGSFGDMAAFSTYMAHLLVTGVGGLVTTNDDDLALRVRSLMAHGRDAIYLSIDDDDLLGDDNRLRRIIERRFSFVRLGYSYRLTELEAAIGLAQLEQKDGWMLARRQNAGKLTELLRPLEEHLQLPTIPPDMEHSYMMYPLVCRREGVRGPLLLHLERAHIETRYLLPLLNQPVYGELFGDIEQRYPVAYHLNRNGFYIGCHHGLTDDDLHYVAERFAEFFRDG
jgi:CDP-6-deoxy-D-xylo-4-hexulose-3-dehydrase